MSQFLFIYIVIIALIAISCATLNVPTYDGEISDHFDGKKFFNPNGPGMGDFKELMKYNRKNKKAKWEFQSNESPVTSVIEDFSDESKIRYYHINHATVLIQWMGLIS